MSCNSCPPEVIFCKSCKYYRMMPDMFDGPTYHCEHPKAIQQENENKEINIATGELDYEAYRSSCSKQRSEEGMCGPSASLYEQRTLSGRFLLIGILLLLPPLFLYAILSFFQMEYYLYPL